MTWSDISRRPDQAAAGFTLIELVVALAILGLVLTFTLPRLSAVLDRLTSSARQQRFENNLAGLRNQAVKTGRTAVLQSSDADRKAGKPPLVELPRGWSLTVEPAITFRYDGLCTGGTVRLDYPGGKRDYRLVSPYCRVEAM